MNNNKTTLNVTKANDTDNSTSDANATNDSVDEP